MGIERWNKVRLWGRSAWFAGAASMVIAIGLSACGSKDADATSGHEHGHEAMASVTSQPAPSALKVGERKKLPNGDIQERTASEKEMPSFLSGQKKEIIEVYRQAALNTELLRYIPCFCGCGAAAGHGSNANCFVKEFGEDGSVVWDDHGTRCDVCLYIAVESITLKQEGKSAKEIRTIIDEKYKEGFAAPTKTPLPL